MEETFNSQTTEMPGCKALRRESRYALRGHWTNAVFCTLVYFIITGVCSAFSSYDGLPMSTNALLGTIGVALYILICLPLSFGYEVAFLRHVRGEEDDDLVTRPFQAFKNYGRYLGTSLLTALFAFLWCLLLIIPGIVKAYSYAMTSFIMVDHPELDADDCIEKSKAMMKGHKLDLFLLDLSYIGWGLLCVLTLGILTLWIAPWNICAHVKFYEELKARQA